MRTKFWLIFAAILAVGVLLLLWRSRSSRTATPVLTIAQAGDFYLYAPLYVANDGGFFKQHGVSIRIVSTGGDDKTWAAVVSNGAQFGIADPTFIAIASQRGQRGKILATIVNGVPFWGITKNPAVPIIRSPAELNGFVVATFPAPSTAYTLQKQMFETAGLPVKIRQGAFGTLLSLTESRQADIALELEPNVSQALTKGYRIVYSLADVYGDFTITGLTATPHFIETNSVAVQAVVDGLRDAMTFLHEHPDEAAALLGRRFPELDQAVCKQALQRVLAAGIIPRTPMVERAAWQKAIDLRVHAGDLVAPGDPMEFIDNSFANQEPGK